MFSLLDICILHFYVWKWCMWNRYHVWSIFLLFYIQYSAFSCITPYMRAWYKLCKIYPTVYRDNRGSVKYLSMLYIDCNSCSKSLMWIAASQSAMYEDFWKICLLPHEHKPKTSLIQSQILFILGAFRILHQKILGSLGPHGYYIRGCTQ